MKLGCQHRYCYVCLETLIRYCYPLPLCARILIYPGLQCRTSLSGLRAAVFKTYRKKPSKRPSISKTARPTRQRRKNTPSQLQIESIAHIPHVRRGSHRAVPVGLYAARAMIVCVVHVEEQPIPPKQTVPRTSISC